MIKNDEDVKTESFNSKNILIFRFEYFASMSDKKSLFSLKTNL